MSRFFRTIRWVYRQLPRALHEQPTFNRFAGWVARNTVGGTEHNVLYDDYYYDRIDEFAAATAPHVAKLVVEEFRPRTVIDVGCGSGAFLAELARAGLTVRGLEYSEAGLAKCRARGLTVDRFDLEKDDLPHLGRQDVAVCTEVAEHLPAHCADRLVDLLARLADALFFTAATPGQGGVDHVNEQPHEYWVGKFEARGWVYDDARSLVWRDRFRDGGVPPFYWKNVMLFRRRTPD